MATSSAPVLIRGETGSGKELVAQAIHAAGPRAGEPLMAINAGALAESVLEKLHGGADFAALEQEYSVDSAVSPGGDLGSLVRGNMDPEFEAAAFALQKPGDLSGVVRSKFGYHVIQLVDPPVSQTRPFGQVQGMIRRQLTRTALADYLDKLRAQAEIVYSEPGSK